MKARPSTTSCSTSWRSKQSSIGSHCAVTGISDISTIAGTPALLTPKVATMTMRMSWVAAHSANSDSKRLTFTQALCELLGGSRHHGLALLVGHAFSDQHRLDSSEHGFASATTTGGGLRGGRCSSSETVPVCGLNSVDQARLALLLVHGQVRGVGLVP